MIFAAGWAALLPTSRKTAAKKKPVKKKPEKPVKAELPEKIDDPVRMYLTQMGEIPLLTRVEEVSLAKKTEVSRKIFRRLVLESGLALDPVLEFLGQVKDGMVPFDRTLKVNPSAQANSSFGVIHFNRRMKKQAIAEDSESGTSDIDGGAGFGDPVHTMRTVRTYEEAGLAGMHIEDQVNPKRCGHLDGKSVVDEDTAIPGSAEGSATLPTRAVSAMP